MSTQELLSHISIIFSVQFIDPVEIGFDLLYKTLLTLLRKEKKCEKFVLG